MSSRKNILISSVVIATFIIASMFMGSNASNATITSISSLPSPAFEDDEVSYAIFFGDNPLVPKAQFSELLSVYSNTFGEEKTVTSSFDQTANSRVYILFGPGVNLSTSSAEFLRKEVIENGKGLLYIAGKDLDGNTSIVANKFFRDFFDYEINNTKQELLTINNRMINGTAISVEVPYVQVTEFVSPHSPVFNNVTKLYFNGTDIQFNETAISEFNDNTTYKIRDYYPLMEEKDYNLGSAFEFESRGRMIVLGSLEMLTNNHLPANGTNSPITGHQNLQFGTNLLQWLGRASGYSKINDYEVSVNNRTNIDVGSLINVRVSLLDEFDNPFTNGIVRVALNSVDKDFTTAFATPSGDGNYSAVLDTKLAQTKQSYSIRVYIERRGYMPQGFEIASQLYVYPEQSGWSLPNLMMIGVLATATIILFSTLFIVWTKYKKSDFAPEE